jgi:hypothetical protein
MFKYYLFFLKLNDREEVMPFLILFLTLKSFNKSFISSELW